MVPLLRGVEKVLSQRLKGTKRMFKNSIGPLLESSPTLRTAPRVCPVSLEQAEGLFPNLLPHLLCALCAFVRAYYSSNLEEAEFHNHQDVHLVITSLE